jgi:pimeloyl-ACP methyl ester carboxylesterase
VRQDVVGRTEYAGSVSIDEEHTGSSSVEDGPHAAITSAQSRRAAVVADHALGEIDWVTPPAGTAVSRFAAPSGSLAFWSMGEISAPPVVLAPGATGSKEDFTLLGPLLVAAGYRVVTYDMAGQYESAGAGPVPGAHYDYDLFVADMVAVLEYTGPAHLLGYSFAGTVAELTTVRRPDLVRSLTLLTAPPLEGQAFRGVRLIGWLSRLTTAHQGAGLMIWGIVTNKNRVGPRQLEFVRSRFALTRRESVDDIIGLMRHIPAVSGPLRDTGVPLLVATGEHDLWPVPLHRAFAERIGASLAVYRTGHSPCETAPHQLTLDMLELFARAERR